MVKKLQSHLASDSKVVSRVVSTFINVSTGLLDKLIADSFLAFSALGNLVGYVLDVAFDNKYDGGIVRW